MITRVFHDLSQSVSFLRPYSNKAAEELPSTSDVDKADDIELQEIAKSMEDLISQLTQTDDLFKYPYVIFWGWINNSQAFEGC